MQHKTGTLRSEYYGRLFIATHCAELIDAGEYGGSGPVRIQVEVARYPNWDDLVEVRRDQDSAETIHGWQVKRQRTGLDKKAMLDLLRALSGSSLHMGHLALHSLEDVKKVGSLQALADLCERVRQPNVNLSIVLEKMFASHRKWVDFTRKELALADDESCLRLFQRLRVEQLGTEDRLLTSALKDLRRWYEDPETILTKILDFLGKTSDEAVVIDYPLLRDTILKGHTPSLRRGQTFTTLRERYLRELLRAHERLPLLKSLFSLRGIRLTDVFVLPSLQLVRASSQAFEESEDSLPVEPEKSRSTNWRWERMLREERDRSAPRNAVDLIDWLRTPHRLQSKTVLIEGAVGSGKSMMLEHIRYTLAKEALQTPEAPLPILFDAQDLSTGEWVSAFKRKAPGVDEEPLLQEEGQKRIYLVDGLDEVPPQHKQQVSSMLDRLSALPETVALILAGRPASAEFPVPTTTPRLRLAPWTEQDIERFLEKWRQKAPGQVEALGTSWRREPMRSVLSNPLTATFSLLLAEEQLESQLGRSALFGGICEKLFHDWSQLRAHQGHAAPPSWGEVSKALQKLALEVISSGRESIRKRELEKLLRKMDPDRNREWMDAASARFGLLVRQGKDSYRFLLRGLAEYLAGQALWREGPQRIATVARERWAEEPVRHAISIAAEQAEPAQVLGLIHQLIPPGTLRSGYGYMEILGDIRTTLIAARAALDLGAAAQPIAAKLSEPLLHYLTLPVSAWVPARAAEEIRMLAHVENPCWSALFPQLKRRLAEPGDLAKWFASQPADRDCQWWLSYLGIADARARTIITARLGRWVDERPVRHALVCQFFDDIEEQHGKAVAPTEAGLALRRATRDPHFEQELRPLLVMLLKENDQLVAGSAAIALKPGEAETNLLVTALRTLAAGYGCPAEVLDELAALPEGRAALDADWEDWPTRSRTGDFERLTPSTHELDHARMPLPASSLPHVLRAIGPTLARLGREGRRALGFMDGMAVVATLAEEALDHPEGILSVLAVAPKETVFSFNTQLVLQEAVVRNPEIARALLAMWEHYQSDNDAYRYPGIALDGLVAAGDMDAARVFAAWLERATPFFNVPGPTLPVSAQALRHPVVKPVAHNLARALLKKHTEGWLNEEGKPTRLWIGTLSNALGMLHPAWEGDTEMESDLVESTIDFEDFHFSHVLNVFRNPPYPERIRASLLERLRRQLGNPEEEKAQFLPAWLDWAERAGEIPGLRAQLEACVRSESWERYNAAAFLLPLHSPTEASALSANVARMWPQYWSRSINAPSDLLRLAAVNPRSWYEHLKITLEEYEFFLAVRNLPVFSLARALLPRLSPEDRRSLMSQLARTVGKYEQPWAGSRLRGIAPRRPADLFLELCFDSGVQT